MLKKSCDNCEFCAGSAKTSGKINCFVSGAVKVKPNAVCDEWELSFSAFQDGDVSDDDFDALCAERK